MRWSVATIVGTEFAHAVPLTATAAFGHLWLGHVDDGCFPGLFLGAIPGMHLGKRMGLTLPATLMRTVPGVLLVGVGVSPLRK